MLTALRIWSFQYLSHSFHRPSSTFPTFRAVDNVRSFLGSQVQPKSHEAFTPVADYQTSSRWHDRGSRSVSTTSTRCLPSCSPSGLTPAMKRASSIPSPPRDQEGPGNKRCALEKGHKKRFVPSVLGNEHDLCKTPSSRNCVQPGTSVLAADPPARAERDFDTGTASRCDLPVPVWRPLSLSFRRFLLSRCAFFHALHPGRHDSHRPRFSRTRRPGPCHGLGSLSLLQHHVGDVSSACN